MKNDKGNFNLQQALRWNMISEIMKSYRFPFSLISFFLDKNLLRCIFKSVEYIVGKLCNSIPKDFLAEDAVSSTNLHLYIFFFTKGLLVGINA